MYLSNGLLPVYSRYYQDQAGGALQGYEGVRRMRGHGFWSRLLQKAVVPLLKFGGKQLLHAGGDVAKEIEAGTPIKAALKKAAVSRGKATGMAAFSTLKSFGKDEIARRQAGAGRRRVKRVKRRAAKATRRTRARAAPVRRRVHKRKSKKRTKKAIFI